MSDENKKRKRVHDIIKNTSGAVGGVAANAYSDKAPTRLTEMSKQTTDYAELIRNIPSDSQMYTPDIQGYRARYFPDENMSVYIRPKIGDSLPAPRLEAKDLEYVFVFRGNTGTAAESELVFSHVPLNMRESAANNLHMLETGKLLEKTIPGLKKAGADIKFVGHSLGGYRAKYFGNKYGIDQELFNAYMFPYNTFGPTNGAKTTFHTIEGDPVDVKYVLPNYRQGETHYVYPTAEHLNKNAVTDFKGALDNHYITAFAPEARVAVAEEHVATSALKALGGGSKAAGAINAAVTGGLVIYDAAHGDYAQAGIDAAEGVVIGTGGAPGAAAVTTYEFGKMMVDDIKEGRKQDAVKHVFEGGVLSAAPFFGLPGVIVGGAVVGLTELVDYLHKKKGIPFDNTHYAMPAPTNEESQAPHTQDESRKESSYVPTHDEASKAYAAYAEIAQRKRDLAEHMAENLKDSLPGQSHNPIQSNENVQPWHPSHAEQMDATAVSSFHTERVSQ